MNAAHGNLFLPHAIHGALACIPLLAPVSIPPPPPLLSRSIDDKMKIVSLRTVEDACCGRRVTSPTAGKHMRQLWLCQLLTPSTLMSFDPPGIMKQRDRKARGWSCHISPDYPLCTCNRPGGGGGGGATDFMHVPVACAQIFVGHDTSRMTHLLCWFQG